MNIDLRIKNKHLKSPIEILSMRNGVYERSRREKLECLRRNDEFSSLSEGTQRRKPTNITRQELLVLFADEKNARIIKKNL
jgi:hypothetical protein